MTVIHVQTKRNLSRPEDRIPVSALLILDYWHLAHDLQRLVTHTIEPAVDSALGKLRILKDSMDTEGAPQKYELQAIIDILERVYRDGEPE